ncbi:MAG: DNA recombination protein RmuC [Patiriisocius sp.]|jgi:DNA recombination protein RmuC
MLEKIVLAFIAGLTVGLIVYWMRSKAIKKINESIRNDILERVIRMEQMEISLEEFKSNLEKSRIENVKLNSEYSSLVANNSFLEKALSTQKEDIANSQERMKMEFENLSNKILDKNSKKITEQSKNDLDQILKPFKEKIKDFETKVENKHVQDVRDRAQLMEKITHLSELNKSMQKETKNLTTALKGDSQKQGNWGELVLERVLEHSGLVKGAEYFTQVHAESDTGKRHRPDVVVNLPENKHVIIDSKVSLTAYEAAIGADDLEVRTGFIKKHLISVKNHVKELNVKNYQGAVGIDSPDFVLMFMPIEASFSLAVKEDADIYNYAWDRKVVIVSPSTLLATLKTVSSLWKQEKQNRNAIEIAAQAGALYDKFVGFTDDLIKVGVQLKNTTKVYEASMNKLTEGKGNLVRRAEQIKVLGAKTTKDINNPLKNRSAVVEQSKESKVD